MLLTSGNSLAAEMVRDAPTKMPISFNNNGALFGFNLFLMTSFMCLGLMIATSTARSVWRHRHEDAARHPVTIWRLAWCCAGTATFLRCGAEAMNLWAWSPSDAATAARVIMAKRWIDPVALAFAGGWMVLTILSNGAMEDQLKKRPYPVNMWATLGSLRQPLAIMVLSLITAIGVVVTR